MLIYLSIQIMNSHWAKGAVSKKHLLYLYKYIYQFPLQMTLPIGPGGFVSRPTLFKRKLAFFVFNISIFWNSSLAKVTLHFGYLFADDLTHAVNLFYSPPSGEGWFSQVSTLDSSTRGFRSGAHSRCALEAKVNLFFGIFFFALIATLFGLPFSFVPCFKS